jgi:hypothetical protein
MLTPEQRQELLEKHENAQFKNRLRLILCGGLMALGSVFFMTIADDPGEQQALGLMAMIGLLAALIGVQD